MGILALRRAPKRLAYETYRLRFTGTCRERQFRKAVARHPYWYHSYYFDNGFEVRGDYDVGANIDEYGFPDDLSGWTVLDVGTASGWFAHYFEQLGATVTTVDIRALDELDKFGDYERRVCAEGASREADAVGSDGEPLFLNAMSRGFWIMRTLLGSRVKFLNANVYDIRPELFGGQTFDLVFIGALLVHLRDPIGALMAARSVCRGQIVTTNWIVPEEVEPKVPFAQLPHLGEDEYYSWWRPNKACYALWLEAAGFTNVDVSATVTLQADLPRAKHYSSTTVNPTQILGLARGHV